MSHKQDASPSNDPLMDSDDPVRNLALSALDAEAQVDDLLRPTEEMVLKVADRLRKDAQRNRKNEPRYLQFMIQEEAADLLETLSAENKALWERCIGYKSQVEANSKRPSYNPETHVRLPREPTPGMWMAMGYDTYAAFIEDYRAMLTAAEEEEG